MLAAVPHSFASSAKEWVIEPSPVPKLAERTIVDLQRPLLKVYPPGAHTLRFVVTFSLTCRVIDRVTSVTAWRRQRPSRAIRIQL